MPGLGAGVSADQRVWGRQSVHLEARADAYKFNNLSELEIRRIVYGLLQAGLPSVSL